MMTIEKYHFSHRLRVRYSECDMQGFVFNANHVIYFQAALQEYFREIGYDQASQDQGTDFHTVKLGVDFFAPIAFDEEVDIHVRTARVGRSSITFELASTKAGAKDVLSLGQIVWVNADQTTHKSAPISAHLLGILRRQEGRDMAEGAS